MTAVLGQNQPARHMPASIFVRGDMRWRDRALCEGMPTEQFFPRKSDIEQETIAICLACPVRPRCLQYALDTRSDYGIWGGTTQVERERLLAGRRKARA